MNRYEDTPSLLNRLLQHDAENNIPMHMPGHKRKTSMLGRALPWAIDITEIDPFDDLHHAQGLLRDSMERAAALFGSRRAYYLVNGSTCGLLAAIGAFAPKKGGSLLVARNCHQAVLHAIELNGLFPHWIDPEVDKATGIAGSISPAALERALAEHPDAAMAVITSPTYEGVISDIASLTDILRAKGIPLIVDEAHGAHLGFSPRFPESAVRLGADCAVQSLHKTLPALTQTAVLHLNAANDIDAEVERQLRIFETSSPSYVLLASMDQCVRALQARGAQWFRDYEERLFAFSMELRGLRHFELLCLGADSPENHPAFYRFDPSKIVILTQRASIGARALAQRLTEKRVIPEMTGREHVLLMSSVCDAAEDLRSVGRMLLDIDASVTGKPGPSRPPLPPSPPQVLAPRDAIRAAGPMTPLPRAEGRIAAEAIWVYPPGIPWVAPGQLLNRDAVAAIGEMASSGVKLRSTYGEVPRSVRTVGDEQT